MGLMENAKRIKALSSQRVKRERKMADFFVPAHVLGDLDVVNESLTR